MKTIVIPDIHGRQSWKLIDFQNVDATEIVFLGDYFDSHEDIMGIEQLNNFEQICKFKEESSKKVTLLIGNHDQIYWPGYTGANVSGYQSNMAISFSAAIYRNAHLLQMSYALDNILFTHAGVSEVWMKNCIEKGGVSILYPKYIAEQIAQFVNDIWKFKPNLFSFCGYHDPYGNEETQTPIWIRPEALKKSSQEIKEAEIIQIVGHTVQKSIDIKGKSTGGKYFFVDTLGTSGEYLIIENNEFKIGKT